MSLSKEISNRFPEGSLPIVLGCGLSVAGAYYLIRIARDRKKRNHLTGLRNRRKKERQEQLADFAIRFPFDEASAAIVTLTFDALVENLQKRKLKAKQVLQAYIAKTITATEEFNSVTQFIDQALEWADELDALPTVKGPLHGVPFCVKEDHDVTGMDSTLGMSIYLYKPKAESAVMVKVLQEAGGIPFCKTNLPQTTIAGSSGNPIYGLTLNPLNKSLSPGGSSSGTGSLVAAGGALFGLGSDIGGSLRIPAHFCGLSSLRSTIGRLSGRGLMPCLEECAGLTSVPGIIASTARILAEVYKIAVADDTQSRHDPLTVPIPWRSEIFNSKKHLRIGYLTSIPIFPPIGDTPETVLKAKEALESLGHTLVPFEIPDPWEIYKIAIAIFGADQGNQTYQKVKYDEISPAAEKFMFGRTVLSAVFMKLVTAFLRSKRMMSVPGVERSEVLWGYLAQQRAAKYAVLDKMRESDLDLILLPAFPFPASKLEDTEHILGSACYTALWNILDFPAGVTPFGEESCTKIDSYDDEGDIFLEIAKKGASLAKDMPIGVQIVGKPFQEEMVLRILTELEGSKLKG